MIIEKLITWRKLVLKKNLTVAQEDKPCFEKNFYQVEICSFIHLFTRLFVKSKITATIKYEKFFLIFNFFNLFCKLCNFAIIFQTFQNFKIFHVFLELLRNVKIVGRWKIGFF